MARCNCSGLVCACKIAAGDNVTVTGSGTAKDPLIISAAGAAGGSAVPTGVYMPYGGSAAPAGWLLCQGQAVSRSTFNALFGVLGTRYGAGDGATTFNVPQMVDRFPVGAGGLYSSGSSGGSASVTLTVAQLPVHAHSINHDHAAFNTVVAGTHTHKLQMSNDSTSVSSSTVQKAGGSGAGDTSAAVETTGGHAHQINVPAYSGNSGNAGGGTPVSVLPPYVASNWIIKT